MLWVKIVNVKTRPNDVADYRYQVGANHTVIARGHVTRHRRADGWRVLLDKVLHAEARNAPTTTSGA